MEVGWGGEGERNRSPFQILSPTNQTVLRSHQRHLGTLRLNSLVIVIIIVIVLRIIILIIQHVPLS